MRSLLLLLPLALAAQNYDIVMSGGRVIDPESGRDAVRYVGINGKKIAAISTSPLHGKIDIDANGLVVTPAPPLRILAMNLQDLERRHPSIGNVSGRDIGPERSSNLPFTGDFKIWFWPLRDTSGQADSRARSQDEIV